MNFSLNDLELEAYNEFYKFCEECNSYREVPYSHLTFTYCFTPTGIGVTCKVKCNQLDLQKDITDYECW